MPEEAARPAPGPPSSAGAAVVKEEDEREPSLLLICLLCAVSVLEGADTPLLQTAMFALQRDLRFAITDIGYLQVGQLVMVNLAAPFWGIIADRGLLRRKTILILGACGQSVVLVVLSSVSSLGLMVFLRTLNGFCLAALRPIVNGIIADVTSEHCRGKSFGRVQSALLFGMFGTTLVAGNLVNKVILGFQGWRVTFVMVGMISAVVAAVVACSMEEPHREEPPDKTGKGLGVVWAEISNLLRFLTIPTFGIMIMQGIFGTIPWSVWGFNLLYFKLCGMPDAPASVLVSANPVISMFGNMIGGYVADFCSRHLGYHGRPLSAQVTVAIGIPIIWALFWGVPAGEGSFAVYFALIAGFGLFATWAQSGTNFPVLSDIVPPKDHCKVMAWELALEHSLANLFGPIFLTQLAEKGFGYKFGAVEAKGKSIPSAQALGKALTCTICIPWVVTFCAYTLLHWSYPRDMRRLKASRASS